MVASDPVWPSMTQYGPVGPLWSHFVILLYTILSDLNVPTCALRLIVSYLSNRRMCVRFNGAESKEQHIPGGGPQGGLLTVLLFDLQVNLAGYPCPLQPVTLPNGVKGPVTRAPLNGPLPLCHQSERTLKKKYVDDLTLLEAICLKLLVWAPLISGPPNLHEIQVFILQPDQSVLQHQLGDLCAFTKEIKMNINFKKTKIMSFNLSKSFDLKFDVKTCVWVLLKSVHKAQGNVPP